MTDRGLLPWNTSIVLLLSLMFTTGLFIKAIHEFKSQYHNKVKK
jgi:hypothetical protein